VRRGSRRRKLRRAPRRGLARGRRRRRAGAQNARTDATRSRLLVPAGPRAPTPRRAARTARVGTTATARPANSRARREPALVSAPQIANATQARNAKSALPARGSSIPPPRATTRSNRASGRDACGAARRSRSPAGTGDASRAHGAARVASGPRIRRRRRAGAQRGIGRDPHAAPRSRMHARPTRRLARMVRVDATAAARAGEAALARIGGASRDRSQPRVVVRPEIDDGAARREGTRDPSAPCAALRSRATGAQAPTRRAARFVRAPATAAARPVRARSLSAKQPRR